MKEEEEEGKKIRKRNQFCSSFAVIDKILYSSTVPAFNVGDC